MVEPENMRIDDEAGTHKHLEKTEAGLKTVFRTLTQQDVDRIVKSRYRKWRKEMEAKVQAAREEGFAEAKALTKLFEEECIQCKYKKLQKQWALKQGELDAREAMIARRELRVEAQELLAKKGLSCKLAEILDYTEANALRKSIAYVEEAFRVSIEAEIDKRMKANSEDIILDGRLTQCATRLISLRRPDKRLGYVTHLHICLGTHEIGAYIKV